jgi:sulfatase maturation enzyme AslB (radical SAM superfamily)/Flp pilus assembly protein TadD
MSDLYQKGLNFEKLNKPDEAIGVFLELIKNEPENNAAAEHLATLYENQNQLENAEKFYNICLKNNYKPERIPFRLACLNIERGNFDKALKYINLCPNQQDTDILRKKAITLKNLNKPDETIKVFLKLAEIEPQNMENFEELGALYENQNQLENAEKFYNICLKNNYKPDEMLLHLSIISAAAGTIDKFCEYFLRINDKRAYLNDDIYHTLIKTISRFTINGAHDKAANLIKVVYENCALGGKDKRSLNTLFNCAEILLGKTKLQSFPQILHIEPTSKCNFDCVMCSKHNNGFELSNSQKDELKEMIPYACAITYTGGEPLLYPHIMELVKTAAQAGLVQTFITNASLLTEKIIKDFARWGVTLAVSIDAPEKEIYEDIRRGGKFEILIKNLELIKKYKALFPHFVTELDFVVMEKNYRYIEQMMDFAAQYAFNRVVFNPISTQPNYSKNFLEYIKNSKLNIFKKAQKHNIALSHCLADHYFESITVPEIKIAEVKKDIRRPEMADDVFVSNLNAALKQLISYKMPTQNSNVLCTLPWTSLFLMERAKTAPGCLCETLEGDWKKYKTLRQMFNSNLFTRYRSAMLSQNKNTLCRAACATKLIPQTHKKQERYN